MTFLRLRFHVQVKPPRVPSLLRRESGASPLTPETGGRRGGGPQFHLEGEVLGPQRLTIKAIFIAAFFGSTLGSGDEPPASAAGNAITASTGAAPAPSAPSIPSASGSSQSTQPGVCGAGMILVDGDYCPDVEQTCLKWIDPPPYQNLRCAEYA